MPKNKTKNNLMKKIILISTVLISLVSIIAFTNKKEKEHRIVFQFTNADTIQQKAFTKQLQNITDYWPNVKIEVVLYNKGLEYLMTDFSKHITEIEALKAKGVNFVVCENTMKQRKIDKSKFIQSATYIPAGIIEIVEKQEQGWSYVKGGY
jgi:intracellular sulfur oxidation DsrE/DsrF family protein